MEIKVGILRELFEEELKKSINILSSSIGVCSTTAAMRVTNIQWLIAT